MSNDFLNFEKASDVEVGDPADIHGNTFTAVEVLPDGNIHFEVSNGDEFDKAPDDLVFVPNV